MNLKLVTDGMTVQVVDDMATGYNARSIRRKSGMSMKEMADFMKISTPYLSELERGKRRWSPVLVNKFNQAKKEWSSVSA